VHGAPAADPGPPPGGEQRPPAPAPEPPQRPRERSYTLMLANADRRIRVLTFVAAGALVLALGVGGLAVAGVIGGSGGPKGINVPALVRAATPSTLLVEMRVDPAVAAALDSEDRRYANGTGWVLDAATGEIVTNAHVAVACQSVRVAMPGGKPREAKVVAVNGCKSVLSILEELPGNQYKLFDVTVSYA
jgi:S1-C subfamily serine protease